MAIQKGTYLSSWVWTDMAWEKSSFVWCWSSEYTVCIRTCDITCRHRVFGADYTGHKFHRVLKVPVSAQLNSRCQSVGSAVTCLEIRLLILIYGHAEILSGFMQFLRTQVRIKSQIRQRPLPVQSINQSLQHAMLTKLVAASFNK